MTTETVAATQTTTPDLASERGLVIAVLLMVVLGGLGMFLISA